jgi:hypothetical protein
MEHTQSPRCQQCGAEEKTVGNVSVGISGGEKSDLPEVLDGKRYRAIDRDQNTWYLSISEVDGRPVEVFASTAFDRDHELQSRISNLTTITRLISLILRHIFLNEKLTLEKCLKQIKRSSRNKNDLPDMLYGVLCRYPEAISSQTSAVSRTAPPSSMDLNNRE